MNVHTNPVERRKHPAIEREGLVRPGCMALKWCSKKKRKKRGSLNSTTDHFF